MVGERIIRVRIEIVRECLETICQDSDDYDRKGHGEIGPEGIGLVRWVYDMEKI